MDQAKPLGRYITILEAVAKLPGGARLSDIVELTGLPKGTASRQVTALLNANLLARVPESNSHFQPGERLVALLQQLLQHSSIHDCFERKLTPLADHFGETVVASELRERKVEAFCTVIPTQAHGATIHPGDRLRPVHACSTAKAILAHQDPKRIKQLTKRSFRFYTQNTITSAEKLESELEHVRTKGYALCDEELDTGVTSIAIPVEIPRVGVVFSIGVVGLTQNMRKHTTDRWVGDLNKTAKKIVQDIRETSNSHVREFLSPRTRSNGEVD